MVTIDRNVLQPVSVPRTVGEEPGQANWVPLSVMKPLQIRAGAPLYHGPLTLGGYSRSA
jgi:hypothetical protein